MKQGTSGSVPQQFSKDRGAPVAEIDVNSRLAVIHLTALACWPRDRRRRGEALVTWAAQILGLLEESAFTHAGMEQLIQTSATKAAAQMGITVENLLALPHARDVVAQARAIPEELNRMVVTELFNPGGGWLAVGAAAMQGNVQQRFEAAHRRGMLAGLIILYCATIRKHHPEMTASYNRAMHIVQTQHARGKIAVGGDRDRKQAWRECRGIGHLWAAVCCGLFVDEQLQASGELFGHPAGIQAILSWAQWFRQFATTHMAVGAVSPLVPPHEAVMINPGAAVLEPPLTPLREELRLAALGYRAPVPSQ